MATNWPPAEGTYPPWPPPELATTQYQAASIWAMAWDLSELGFTLDTATPQERNLYFKDASCDEGHNVQGRMVVSPSGQRYPFAICLDPQHRSLLCLWPPYEMGAGSGIELGV